MESPPGDKGVEGAGHFPMKGRGCSLPVNQIMVLLGVLEIKCYYF